MSRDTTVIRFRQPDAIDDPLTELAREGARRMLATVLIAEADDFVALWKDLKLPDGRDRVVRHGHGPQRAIQTGVGPVAVRRAKVRDRGQVGAAEKIRFTSSILPKWARRTKSLDALLPILYLRGLSTGDFQEALSALLGKDAPNLSPAVITRLTAEWQADYEAWQKRDLSARRYVYVWADGVQGADGSRRECMLDADRRTRRQEGTRRLPDRGARARRAGVNSWSTCKRRGLEIAPDLAVGDGALGFWKAIEEVFPGTRHQRCWVHKTTNVLNKVALSIQLNMKASVREMYGAPTRAAAEAAINVFADKYGAKYDKAVACSDQGSRGPARLLRFSRRALGPPAHREPHRERVCHGPSSNCADQRIAVAQDRQAHGVQARLRRRQNLAAVEGRKPVAESRPRHQIPKRRRGHRSAGSAAPPDRPHHPKSCIALYHSNRRKRLRPRTPRLCRTTGRSSAFAQPRTDARHRDKTPTAAETEGTRLRPLSARSDRCAGTSHAVQLRPAGDEGGNPAPRCSSCARSAASTSIEGQRGGVRSSGESRGSAHRRWTQSKRRARPRIVRTGATGADGDRFGEVRIGWRILRPTCGRHRERGPAALHGDFGASTGVRTASFPLGQAAGRAATGVVRHPRAPFDGAADNDLHYRWFVGARHRRLWYWMPIPTKPPVYNGMIAPRDSWMMPPPCNEMIPPGAPRCWPRKFFPSGVSGQAVLDCLPRVRRRLSPVSSMRCALCTRRSRMASA